ncbi:MAG: hypothetical protein KatS3mg107_0785 [Gemmataceae bacterium]|nr:MAG: hypothetical protein KatS3mg107_0785 [Gemmataceae bacterium]
MQRREWLRSSLFAVLAHLSGGKSGGTAAPIGHTADLTAWQRGYSHPVSRRC